MLNDALFGTIVVTGLTVAFLHAALPTHWLPFVLAGKRQRWDGGKTLTITALAGGGHVLFTVALGVLVAVFGFTVDRWTGGVFPYIAAGVLVLFGMLFWTRDGHGHSHFSDDETRKAQSLDDRTVIIGLLTALTFSPCEGFLPVFAAAVKFGWGGFALLCLVLALATLAGMMLMTWLTMRGIQHARFDRLEGHEGKISGALLIVLAIAVIVLET